jgi:hypothetical protein
MSLVATFLYLHTFRDISSGMWVFRREILKHLDLHTNGWEFSNEIKLEAYFAGGPGRFGEFVIPYDERVGDTHNQTIWRTGIEVVAFMAYERFRHFMRGRVTDPRPGVRTLEMQMQIEPERHAPLTNRLEQRS